MFSFEEAIIELAEHDPEGVAALLDGLALRPNVRARLVAQLDDAGLKKLEAILGRTFSTEGSRELAPGDSRSLETDEAIYIVNAGLVLAAVFLPKLFAELGLLSDVGEKTALRDAEAGSRAVHLLQFLADGQLSAPEHSLV